MAEVDRTAGRAVEGRPDAHRVVGLTTNGQGGVVGGEHEALILHPKLLGGGAKGLEEPVGHGDVGAPDR